MGQKLPRPGVEQFSSIKGQKISQALRPYSLITVTQFCLSEVKPFTKNTSAREFDHGPRNQKCYHVYKELINIRQK